MISTLCIMLTVPFALYAAPPNITSSEERYLQNIDRDMQFVPPVNHTLFLRHKLVEQRRDKKEEEKKVLEARLRTMSMEKDRDQMTDYANDRYCASSLRSAIDGMRLRSVSYHTDDQKRQNALTGELGIIWKNRENTLRSVLFKLSRVMNSLQDDPQVIICDEGAEQTFNTQVKLLRELKISCPTMPSLYVVDQLITEIAFLNEDWKESMSNSSLWTQWVQNHGQFWFNKSLVWQSEKEFNHPRDVLIIKRLVKQVNVDETMGMKAITLPELAYLKAIVQGHVEDLKLTTQAEMCLWITAVHPSSYFSRVVEEVSRNSEEWKALSAAERQLLFCEASGRFYNALSVLDQHRDAPPPPGSCPVGSPDFMKYVTRISYGLPELKIVGDAFVKLTA